MNSSFKEKFGKRLKKLRKSTGFTQEQLGELVAIEPPNISKIECGMHFPQPDKIEKIAKALNIEIHELFEFEECKNRQELIKDILNTVNSFEMNKLELAHKFIYNLKLFK